MATRQPTTNSLAAQEADASLANRAAWLAYIGGYTQEQVAERLGVSRAKAHRLISAAFDSGQVKVFVEGGPAECIALEDRLQGGFGLAGCVVVPDQGAVDEADPDRNLVAIGMAGARYLMGVLEPGDVTTVGIGHGRTLAAMVQRLPRMNLPQVRFVSLIGSLTRKSSANPFDVISRLAELTGSESYFMPAPFFAETVADARVLRSQRAVSHVMGLIKECQLCLVGIGAIGPRAHMFETRMITADEHASLRHAGAVGDLMGHFLDRDGRAVDCELNRRGLGATLEELRGRDVVALAGGLYKVPAILAALRSGVLTRLVTDEPTARQLIKGLNHVEPGLTQPVRSRRIPA